jgi:hypothetical protein
MKLLSFVDSVPAKLAVDFVGSKQATQQEQLDALIELLDQIEQRGGVLVRSNQSSDEFDEQTIENQSFWDWIYSRSSSNSDIDDLKRLLAHRLYHIKKSAQADKEVASIRSQREKQKPIINEKFCDVYCLDKNSVFGVWTVNDIFLVKRRYLRCESDSSKVFMDLPECFSHLYFHPTVKDSLNKFKTTVFRVIEDEMFDHLSKIDGYYQQFVVERNSGTIKMMIADNFSRATAISCSPQRSRSAANETVKNFMKNDDSGKRSVNVMCELHTKFSHRKEYAARNVPRIYFSEGDDHIEYGKVLIAYIGPHL